VTTQVEFLLIASSSLVAAVQIDSQQNTNVLYLLCFRYTYVQRHFVNGYSNNALPNIIIIIIITTTIIVVVTTTIITTTIILLLLIIIIILIIITIIIIIIVVVIIVIMIIIIIIIMSVYLWMSNAAIQYNNKLKC